MAERYKDIPAYYSGRTEEELDVRKAIFDEGFVFDNIGKYYYDLGPTNCGFDDFPNEFSNGGHIEEVPYVPATALLRKTRREEKFEKTESENIEILKKIILLIENAIPNAYVILTLIPRYGAIEDIHAENQYMIAQKNKFMKYIEEVVDGKKTLFFNLKQQTSISGNHYFWKDEQHLNYQGSIALTSIYEELLNKI